MWALLHYSFIQNALLSSAFVAIVAAFAGYFLLIRRLTFAGHAISHIGFAGAAGAVWLGFDPVFGLLLFTILGGIGIGIWGNVLRERDVTIGIFLTLALSLGILFLFLYQGYAEQAYSILFGTILGINTQDVFITALLSIIVCGLLLVLFRPLLFASFDADVAEARGVPVRFLSIMLLLIIAVTVSLSVQVVGVLLIFTLLVGPVAGAMRLTQNPVVTILIAMVLGIFYSWTGILFAALTNLPVSFFIATLSFGVYLLIRMRELLI
ncbi:MAG TPA: metal ABC transporter permease [Patescibacteria group bacterium]|nr:metal ABC transporter permease [Patescibacteria group bacterium]